MNGNWVRCSLLLAASACTGSIVGAREPRPAPAPTPVDPSPEPTNECAQLTPRAGTNELQRLTARELDATVRAVLQDGTGAFQSRLASSDELLSARLRYFRARAASPAWAEASILAAEDVSLDVAPRLSQCAATDAPGKRACAEQLVRTLGRRLWRHTLGTSELNSVMATYDAALTDGTHADGVQTAVMTLLASPDFFFFHQPPPGESPKGTVLAERLAFTLWRQAPDDALLDAAEAGALDEVDGLDATVRRMVNDPRADTSFAEFLSHWLAPEKSATIHQALAAQTRQPQLYPSFRPPASGADGTAFAQALDAYLAREASLSTGTFERLLTSPTLAVNEAVARNLKLPAPSSSLELRASDTARRVGVLGQPAVMTAFGRFESSDPVHRGVFLLRHTVCNDVPPPDASVNAVLPPAESFTTTRARFSAATVAPACSGCHGLINPLGFAFEHFDAVGAFREQENGSAIDAKVTLPLEGEPRIDGLPDLARVLASDPVVRACVARQYSAWALRRSLTQEEWCSVRAKGADFLSGPGALSSLVGAVIRSDAFSSSTPPVP